MAKAVRLHVVCLECERRFSTSNPMPECPSCGGTDVELADEVGIAAAASHRETLTPADNR